MVRALIDGRKTQTRRALNPQPYQLESRSGYWNASGAVGGRIVTSDRALLDLYRKPEPGDRLYVGERYYQLSHWEPVEGQLSKGGRQKWAFTPDTDQILFDAPAGETVRLGRHHKDASTVAWHKRLGRFMAKKHSRLTLIVTDVRVERLQDISEADAIAEGVERAPKNDGWWKSQTSGQLCPTARDAYGDLWNSINGAGAWEANPWVVAYTFTVHRGNIDERGSADGH
jgi:hypothetical protein